MKNKFSKLALATGIVLALALTFSCQSYKYCIQADNTCLDGPFTAGACRGQVSNSCPNDPNPDIFKTVQIGSQTWMADNLNYAVEGSKCYGEGGLVHKLDTIHGEGGLDIISSDITLSSSEIQANCSKYGRLYDWATAMSLPSKCNKVPSTSDADCAITTPNHRGVCPVGWHIPSDADWNVLMKLVNPSCSNNSNCVGAGKKLKATSGWNGYNGSGNGTDEYGFAALPGGSSNGVYFDNVGDIGYWWSATDFGGFASIWGMLYSHDILRYYSDHKSTLFSVRCVKD